MNTDNTNNELIQKVIEYVKETLKNAESGHDWFHIERVWKNSLTIANQQAEIEKTKGNTVNFLIVQLGALLHDIADHKFHGGDDKIGAKVAKEFLSKLNVDETTVDAVCNIIEKISFKGSSSENQMDSIEGLIVQDADRLDAIGAIGVARAFSYGGYRNRQMYDPEEQPKLNMNWEEYKKNQGTTINHFYEKLLLIKDRMNTEAGRKIAEARHDYMANFLQQFYDEWNGKC